MSFIKPTLALSCLLATAAPAMAEAEVTVNNEAPKPVEQIDLRPYLQTLINQQNQPQQPVSYPVVSPGNGAPSVVVIPITTGQGSQSSSMTDLLVMQMLLDQRRERNKPEPKPARGIGYHLGRSLETATYGFMQGAAQETGSRVIQSLW